jgi:hypothetical protein
MKPIYPFKKLHIAKAAADLLAACDWDIDAALVAVEAQRPIAAMPELDPHGNPKTAKSDEQP